MTRQNGGTYATVDGSRGQFEVQLQCYGQQFCPRGDPVIEDSSGPHGRTIWYTNKQLRIPLSERFQNVALGGDSRQPKRNAALVTPVPNSDLGWDKLKTASSGEENKVETLLSSLSDPGWKKLISEAVAQDETFRGLADFLVGEVTSGKTIYPPHEDVFAALNSCPLENVKVVCVGQDPYHGPSQGHGLSFSVRKGVPPPPSLINIFKEAIEDVGIFAPAHGNLEHWTQQGVLMLNTVLTVRRGEANSHRGKGWEQFTDFIIQHLDARKEGLVFLLFGNPAHKKANSVNGKKHSLIRTSHPSPLGATKTSSPFLGSKCFSRCNHALIEQGVQPIDWNVR